MRHRLATGVFVALAMCAAAVPASAQQSITFQVGAFMPRGEDSRIAGDVLLVNSQYLINRDTGRFDVSDFNAMTVGGEWSAALGQYLELSAGFGFYQRTVHTVYADWVNDDGTEIQQDLKLRIMPATFLVKIVPFGMRSKVQPYVGGGLGVYFWRYSETGEFVDFYDNSIFSDNFVQSGTSAGPVAVFGLRGRVSRTALLGVEFRYQWGEGNLSTQDFLSDKIDLGGYSVLGTFGYRF
jgi:hypothetical protein